MLYGYIRVSTSEQANNGQSLETQERQLRGQAMVLGQELAEIFIERGCSGSVPLADRPQGQALLEVLRRGDVVIVCKLDRIFRSVLDALGTLEVFRDEDVGLHIMDLGGDVVRNGMSKFMFTILSAFAEAERDRIRERIREVRHDMAERGLYGGGKIPYGYVVVEGKLVPDGDQQLGISEMVKMRSGGDSYAKIGQRFGKPAMSIKRILDRVNRDK